MKIPFWFCWLPASVWTYLFWLLALAFSLFYTWKCFTAFRVNTEKIKEYLENTGHKSWPWFVHQRWFNFVGSVSGWFSLWAFITRTRPPSSHIDRWDRWDVALAFVAFIGVTGHLPYAVFGVLTGLNTLAGKALEKVGIAISEKPKP